MAKSLLRKDQLEVSLQNEHKMIQAGKLKEDHPLDESENFNQLCNGARMGNLGLCQQMIAAGANINARDKYDYNPLILVCVYAIIQTRSHSGV